MAITNSLRAFERPLLLIACTTALLWGCLSESQPGSNNNDDGDELGGAGGGSDLGGASGHNNDAGHDGEGGVGGAAGGESPQMGEPDAGASTGGSGGAEPSSQGGTTPATPPSFQTDFESAMVGKVPPSPFTGGDGKVIVDDSKAFSGQKSMKVQSDSGIAMVTIPSSRYTTASKKTIYTRFMIWMDALPAGTGRGSDGHWDIIRHDVVYRGGGFNIHGHFSFGGFADKAHKLHMFGDDAGGAGRQDCTRRSSIQIPLKQWACVETKIDENDVINYEIRIDGAAVPEFSFLSDSGGSECVTQWNITKGIWYIPEVLSTRFGFRHVHTQLTPMTIWFDDIAIDTKPIGCPSK